MENIAPVWITMRWLHIISATLFVGVPLFMRFVLAPATQTLPPDLQADLNARVMQRWRKWIYTVILLFLVSGLYQFLVVARWKNMAPRTQGLYHALFGMHFLLGLCIFFLASALAGRSKALAVIRQKGTLFLNLNIVLALLTVLISGTLRSLPEDKYATAPLTLPLPAR